MRDMGALSSVRTTALALAALLLCASTAYAQGQDLSQVEIQTREVAPGLYMMMGAGGNLAVSIGEDGVILIDDQYAPLSEKIKAASRSSRTPPCASCSTRTGTATTPAETRTSERPAP